MFSMTTPRSCLNVRRSVHTILSSYADILHNSAENVLYAFLAWAHAGMPGAVEMRPLVKGEARTSIRTNVDSWEHAATAYSQARGWRYPPSRIVEFIVLRAPMPPQPELLTSYLVESKSAPAGEPSTPVSFVTFSKRQTTHLRHLARAWDMTVPAVVQVLVASNPSMHLPVTVTPTMVTSALRGVQALPVGAEQETVVIAD